MFASVTERQTSAASGTTSAKRHKRALRPRSAYQPLRALCFRRADEGMRYWRAARCANAVVCRCANAFKPKQRRTAARTRCWRA